ncbi:MAG: hypothetical protein J0L94_02810 [Rhodothermia bacterium]|nr:hypothetical protein [Rhodothermia bacterium]
MKNKANWSHVLFMLGVAAVLLGAIDPLEGSIVVFLGSVLLSVSTHFMQDSCRKTFLLAAVLIAIGTAAMWGFTALGGIGGATPYPMWWAVFTLPYPIGWLVCLYALIRRWMGRRNLKVVT